MTSSAERSAPHPGSKLPPPLSPPHVGGGGVQRPLLYRHRYSRLARAAERLRRPDREDSLRAIGSMTSSAERSAPHPGSKLPPPLSPPHVGGGGVQRPLLYRHRCSSFGARSGASPLTRSRGSTPRDRLDAFKRRR